MEDSRVILTKLQRRVYYIKALEWLEEYTGTYVGLCKAIQQGNDIIMPIYGKSTLCPFTHMEQYPEIYKHKVWDSVYWFPKDKEGYQKRIEILKQAIQETKQI